MTKKNDDDINKDDMAVSEQAEPAQEDNKDQESKQEKIQEKLKTMGVMAGEKKHEESSGRSGVLWMVLLVAFVAILVVYYFQAEPINRWVAENINSLSNNVQQTEAVNTAAVANNRQSDPMAAYPQYNRSPPPVTAQADVFNQRREDMKVRQADLDERRQEIDQLRADLDQKMKEYQDQLFAMAKQDRPMPDMASRYDTPQWVKDRRAQMERTMKDYQQQWQNQPTGWGPQPDYMRHPAMNNPAMNYPQNTNPVEGMQPGASTQQESQMPPAEAYPQPYAYPPQAYYSQGPAYNYAPGPYAGPGPGAYGGYGY